MNSRFLIFSLTTSILPRLRRSLSCCLRPAACVLPPARFAPRPPSPVSGDACHRRRRRRHGLRPPRQSRRHAARNHVMAVVAEGLARAELIQGHRLVEFHHHGHAAEAYGVPQVGPEFHIPRSEEHTSELQSLMRISYAVFCLKTKK